MPNSATRAIANRIGFPSDDDVSALSSLPDQAPVEASPRRQLGVFVADQPLASFYPIPSSIARIVMDADREIAGGRLESALDLTLLAEIEAPGCIGLFVRQAELLLATGRPDSATHIVSGIKTSTDAGDGSSLMVEIERILMHARPTDESVIQLARSALAARRIDLIDRYMPAAIEAATLQTDAHLAAELAQSWLEIRPDNLDAAFALTREMMRTGQRSEAEVLAAALPENSVDLRAHIIRLVLECAANSPRQWDVLAQLLAGIQSSQIDPTAAQELLHQIIAVQPPNETLLVHQGVLEIHAGNPNAARLLLHSVRPAEPDAAYIAAVASARAALASGDGVSANDALRQAIQLFEQPDVAEFARSCPVLRAPYDMFSVGKAVAGALQQSGEAGEATTLLERLAGLAPDRQDLARAYADALARSGKREVAIAQLEEMLRHHEKKGEFEALQLTVQALLQISPGNLRLRARLIDEYMKRGKLQEAVQERWTQAQILERAGRIDEAVEQLLRAADVAAVLGDYKKLESILRLMIRIRPDDMDVRHSAATKFIEFGQIQLAIEQLWGVVEISSQQNNPDDTIAALHQIIALGPHEVDAYHRLGEVLASVGEYAQAERVYRRLMTLLPDDPAIQAKQSALAAMAKDRPA
jgi:tetratricopeptide (TPR) repeat protein